MAIIKELQRRSVVQTAALYIAIAWGGIEIIAFLIKALWGEQPADIASKYLAILLIAGFPVAMYLAWTRDLGRKARRYVSATAMAVLLVAVLVWLLPAERATPVAQRATASEIKALAVLPLDNLSGDPGQDYFAAGMTEALIAELSKVGAFKVISRTSIMRYLGTTRPLPEIARELGVDAIVEGSVLRSGNQVRITAQLIEAATDHHLWADSIEGEMEDVLALQNRAARSMVKGIGANMARQGAVDKSPRQVRPEAYDAFLKAKMSYLGARNDPHQAIQVVEKVIELDPTFAPAYALLSDMYGYLVLTTNITDGEAYLRARQLARRAVELDSDLPYARVAMGRVHFQYEWDWESAEIELEHALRLDPNNSDALMMYGAYRSLIHKDCDEGIRLLEMARDLDPFNPATHFDLGIYSFHCRHHEESIKHMQRTLELVPSFLWAKMVISWNYELLGQHDRANIACDQLLESPVQEFDAILFSSCAWVYARTDRREAAIQLMTKLREPPAGIHVDPITISWGCVGLGDTECALEELEKSFQQRSSNLIFLRTAPAFDDIRSDPRFKAFVAKMRFPS